MKEKQKGYAGASLLLGVVSVVMFPLFVALYVHAVLVVALLAIGLGIASLRSDRRAIAILGIVLGMLPCMALVVISIL